MSGSGQKVVLVIEDEPFVRMIAVEAFEDEGFEVLEASDAESGRAILAQRPDVTALFTDIEMPGAINGLSLAHQSRSTHPTLGIVLASGRAHPRQQETPDGTVFLSKPYTPDQAVSAVAAVLRGRID